MKKLILSSMILAASLLASSASAEVDTKNGSVMGTSSFLDLEILGMKNKGSVHIFGDAAEGLFQSMTKAPRETQEAPDLKPNDPVSKFHTRVSSQVHCAKFYKRKQLSNGDLVWVRDPLHKRIPEYRCEIGLINLEEGKVQLRYCGTAPYPPCK